jgi:3-dehydroquinate synthase
MTKSWFTGNEAHTKLTELLSQTVSAKQRLVILTDENTREKCLPRFHELTGNIATDADCISFPPGEASKTLHTATNIWSELTRMKADRETFLLNLGGGVVTDMGGFVASTFKRGIRTIHVPTTMMGMTDAAIGGKTGVDFQYLKNIIGTFYQPVAVCIMPEFLKSLPENHLIQGYAEVFKYGFIKNPDLLQALPHDPAKTEEIIRQCVQIKTEITDTDPLEKGPRKLLNFGHTIGHAFESFALEHDIELLHGEAVAAGMLCELYLSAQLLGLNPKVLKNYLMTWKQYFPALVINQEHYDELLGYVAQDKKNLNQRILLTLVQSPGKVVYNIPVETHLIMDSFNYYRSVTE